MFKVSFGFSTLNRKAISPFILTLCKENNKMRTEKDFNRAGFYISIPVEEVESFRKQKKRSLSLLKVRPGSLYLFRL